MVRGYSYDQSVERIYRHKRQEAYCSLNKVFYIFNIYVLYVLNAFYSYFNLSILYLTSKIRIEHHKVDFLRKGRLEKRMYCVQYSVL